MSLPASRRVLSMSSSQPVDFGCALMPVTCEYAGRVPDVGALAANPSPDCAPEGADGEGGVDGAFCANQSSFGITAPQQLREPCSALPGQPVQLSSAHSGRAS